MADLRATLLDLGYADVATLLNSGNAVFRAREAAAVRHAARVSGAVAERFGFEVPVVVKSARELAAIVEGNPIAVATQDHARLLVVFAQDAATFSGLESRVEPPERLAIGAGAAYLFCAEGILASRAAKALPGLAGPQVTTRNWSTVLKLRAMVEGTARS